MSEETQQNADQTTETPVVETPQVEEPKVHPAYDKLLSELPEAWHAKITPHLQEQDKYFQQQLEKYTPFKDLVEEGVSADVIKGGLGLARAIDQDPVTVYQNLQKYLKDQGLLAEEAKQAAADMMEEASGDNLEDIFDNENIPAALKRELDTLRAKTEEVDSWRNQQEFERETQTQLAQLDADMAQLRSQHNISEAHEIAIYDLMNAALSGGREVTIAEAAKQLSDMIGGFPSGNSVAQEEAPTIMGSSGGAGVVAPNLSIPKDDKGKKEMLARMFDKYNSANR
jgi:hypothetical protein